MKELIGKIEKFKYPLLILALGVVLMLLPSGSGREAPQEQQSLSEALSLTQGVGEAYVLISENGVVVVCDGASDAGIRMDIIEAVKAFTGFGADKITILKRA